MKRPRLSFTTSPQVSEAIDALLWTGLWGATRSAVVERLVCHAILDVTPPEILKDIAYEMEMESDSVEVASAECGHA